MGIDYKSACLVEASTYYEGLICGDNWQQTNFNKIAIPLIIFLLVIVSVFIVYRVIKRATRK